MSQRERDAVIESLQLLRDNTDLIQKCKNEYMVKNNECERAISYLNQQLSSVLTQRLQIQCLTSGVYVLAVPGFISELRRWAGLLQQSKQPSDLIDLAKAVELYHRSRAQLKRDIKGELITDYRKTERGKHWISRSEADNLYTPKQKSY